MEVRFMIVPPGGGEIDYVMFADIPALPREKDYIQVTGKRDGEFYADYFIVRRVWWPFKDLGQENGKITLADEIGIEVEEAIGGFTSEKDKKRMQQNGHQEFEDTAF